MELISLLLFGAAVGLVADFLDRKHDNNLVLNIVLGVFGALIGGFVRYAFTGNNAGANHLDVWSFLWALVTTFVLMLAYHAVRDRTSRV